MKIGETINLIVAGGGEGLYKNLYPSTQSTDPNLNMKIRAVVDIVPREKLHPKTIEILGKELVDYIQADDEHGHKKIIATDLKNTAAIVMTPNDSHLAYTEFFASVIGIPVYIEKPAVTSLKDLQKFLEAARKYPQLIYAAEYCTDGKALALLLAGGTIKDSDPRARYLKIEPEINREELSRIFLKELGRPKEIRGKMLEGEGTAGTADHRMWLLDGIHGGMIRDLASHIFGPLYDIGFASSDIIEPKVELGKYESGESLGTFRPLTNPKEGETYASIEGKFIAPCGMPRFRFEVGKYWPRNERFLEIICENGYATLSYEKPFELKIETAHGKPISITVTADFYPTLAFLDFEEFIYGHANGHIDRADAIVTFNEKVRLAGLQSSIQFV